MDDSILTKSAKGIILDFKVKRPVMVADQY